MTENPLRAALEQLLWEAEDGYATSPLAREAARAALAAPSTEQAKPVAWARKWHIDGEIPKKEKNASGRLAWPGKFKILPVTNGKCFPDDVPLYATPQPQPAIPAAPDQHCRDYPNDMICGNCGHEFGHHAGLTCVVIPGMFDPQQAAPEQAKPVDGEWLQAGGLLYVLRNGENHYEVNVTMAGTRKDADCAEFATSLLPLLATPQPQPAIPAALEQKTQRYSWLMDHAAEEITRVGLHAFAGSLIEAGSAILHAQQAAPEQATCPVCKDIPRKFVACIECGRDLAAPSPQQRDESKDAPLHNEWVRLHQTSWMHGGQIGGSIPTFEDWKAKRAIAQERTS